MEPTEVNANRFARLPGERTSLDEKRGRPDPRTGESPMRNAYALAVAPMSSEAWKCGKSYMSFAVGTKSSGAPAGIGGSRRGLALNWPRILLKWVAVQECRWGRSTASRSWGSVTRLMMRG